jgi:diguanylate cyclase (GGDEF)-like protein
MHMHTSSRPVYPWLAVLAFSGLFWGGAFSLASAEDYYALATGGMAWGHLWILLIVKLGLHLTLMGFLWRTAWKEKNKAAQLIFLFLGLATAFNMSSFRDITFLQTPQFGHIGSVALVFGGAMLVTALIFARQWLTQTTPLRNAVLAQDELSLNPSLGGSFDEAPQGVLDDRLVLIWQTLEVSIGVSVLGTAFIWPQVSAEILLWSWCFCLFAGAGTFAYLMNRGIKTAEMLLIGWAPALAGNLFAVSISGESTNFGLLLHGVSILAGLLAWAYYGVMLVNPMKSSLTEASAPIKETETMLSTASVVWETSPESLVPYNKVRRAALEAQKATGSVFAWDVDANAFTFSPRALALLGLYSHTSPHRFSGAMSWMDHVHIVDQDLIEKILNAESSQLPAVITVDFRINPEKEGQEERWIRLQASIFDDQESIDSNENTRVFWGTLADVTADKTVESPFSYTNHPDPVTNLAGRNALLERLTQVLKQAKEQVLQRFEQGEASSLVETADILVATLDIDQFSHINQAIGYEGGDKVLSEMANRLQTLCTAQDLIARSGDDSFTLIKLHIRNDQEAIHFAQTLLQAMRSPILINQKEIFVNVSLGLARVTEGVQMAEDLLVAAELALQEAKPKTGRGRFALSQPKKSGQSKHYDPIVLQSGLYHALERNQLIPYFQPIIRLKDRRIMGAEVLLRWNHPDYGLLAPAQFLSLAEKSGHIIPIGRFMLARAAEQLSRWHGQQVKLFGESYERLFLSVNLSSHQLLHETLLPDLKTLFEVFKLPSRTLKIEITESSLLDDKERTIDIMQQARQQGVGFGVDDFGKGYSSLSYLQRFPFEWIKIDQSIIQSCDEDWASRVVVRSIIDLGHELGMDVLAEGVENVTLLDRLMVLGCDYVQGYVYGAPMPAHQFEQLIFTPQRTSTETQAIPMIATPLSSSEIRRSVLDHQGHDEDLKDKDLSRDLIFS